MADGMARAADPRILAALPAWLTAKRGGRGEIVARLAVDMGLSTQSVYRQLAQQSEGLRTRKRRSDAGKSSVSEREVQQIAAVVEETRRKTGTGALPLEEALKVARANGLAAAERLDKATGELKPASLSTVRRAMRTHFVHRRQLEVATPAARLSSPHPNYLWQVDASICTQYYLADEGLKPLPAGEFYKNKPQNIAKTEKQRLWRYVITDHASGCLEVFYVLGAESAANLSASLIHAMTCRPLGTMHGVPQMLMMDPGSASTSSQVRNLLAPLGIKPMINEVGNARAKGQVEGAHYLVETHFEARLALRAAVTSLEEINTLAQTWARQFNATRIHTRTGTTRRDAWLRIKPEQLVAAPSIALLRGLPNSDPKSCVVRDYLVKFKGRTYDVRGIPELLNGERVDVLVNALDPDGSARVLVAGKEGIEPVHYMAPCVERDAFGFLSTAAQVGVEYKSPPQSPAQAASAELERTAMQVTTDEEAKAARKAKKLPFGGNVDPFKDVNATAITPALPRAATPSRMEAPQVVDLALRVCIDDVTTPAREFPPYTHFEAARAMKPRLEARGITWTAALMEATQRAYPDGVPYDQLDALCEQLIGRNRLRAVGGGQ